MMSGQPSAAGRRLSVTEWVLLAAVLGVSGGVAFATALHKMMDFDELLSYFTDIAPTARDVLHIQTHSPVSLDPPAYHLLSHWSLQIFSPSCLAVRLPALCGYLLMQVCLFELVRRIAGPRAGILAATLPLISPNFYYASFGRPYAVLLGLNAAALLLWYLTKTASTSTRHATACVMLGAVLMLAILMHFWGLLILFPVTIAEAVHTISRRRIDWGAVASLGAGFASVVLLLPFMLAVAPYRHNYYVGYVSADVIPYSYRYLLFGGNAYERNNAPLLLLAAVLAFLAVALASLLRRPGNLPVGLWAGLLALALFPFFGYALAANFVHIFELRHVLPVVVAFPILLSVWVAPLLENRSFPVWMTVVLLFVGIRGISQVRVETEQTQLRLSVLSEVSPSARAALVARPMSSIYVQDIPYFLQSKYYFPDSDVTRRMVLVYDEEREHQWRWSSTFSITAETFPRFTPFASASFDQMMARPDPIALLLPNPNHWLPDELRAKGYTLTSLGIAEGGDLCTLGPPPPTSVSLPAEASAESKSASK
jgi:hypothetical protein